MTKQLGFAILGSIWVPIIFWLGGYNFDSRGVEAVLCAVGSVMAFAWGWVGYHLIYD